MSWAPSGFSVFVGEPIGHEDTETLRRLARYLARPSVASRRVWRTAEDKIRILASSPDRPDVELDPIEAVHRLLLHVPRKGQHQVRYYGAYANRQRRLYQSTPREQADARQARVAGETRDGEDVLVDRDDPFEMARRQSWARLLQRVFEVDPLLCPTCGERMQIVGFVTQALVVDKILRHRRERQLTSPFESRAPPAA